MLWCERLSVMNQLVETLKFDIVARTTAYALRATDTLLHYQSPQSVCAIHYLMLTVGLLLYLKGELLNYLFALQSFNFMLFFLLRFLPRVNIYLSLLVYLRALNGPNLRKHVPVLFLILTILLPPLLPPLTLPLHFLLLLDAPAPLADAVGEHAAKD